VSSISSTEAQPGRLSSCSIEVQCGSHILLVSDSEVAELESKDGERDKAIVKKLRLHESHSNCWWFLLMWIIIWSMMMLAVVADDWIQPREVCTSSEVSEAFPSHSSSECASYGRSGWVPAPLPRSLGFHERERSRNTSTPLSTTSVKLLINLRPVPAVWTQQIELVNTSNLKGLIVIT
jgi:hypothetical protein